MVVRCARQGSRSAAQRDVRLLAVRSTYRQLEQEGDRLWKRLRRRPGTEWLMSGISTTRNALGIDVDYRVPGHPPGVPREEKTEWSFY